MKRKMIGVILAAGNGTRFAENGCCKPLLRIGGKYLIEYPLENLLSLQVERALIVVGKYHDRIRAALGDTYRGISLEYVIQEISAGCIHALCCTLPYWNGETVILQLADEIFLGFDTPAAALPQSADFACGYTQAADKEIIKENYSIQCTSRTNRISLCTEKPKFVRNHKKGTGFCMFRPVCITLLQERYISALDQCVTLCDFMNHLIRDGKNGIAIRIAGEEININTPEQVDYAERAIRELMKNE